MIKPNFYTYTHLFKYVNYHPYFIFYHPNNNEIFEEDENEEQNSDLLNFKLEYFEQKLDNFVFDNFDDSLRKEYQKIELYEDKTLHKMKSGENFNTISSIVYMEPIKTFPK